jgi:Spy/CpxP family protein refolding chaperone
MRKRILIASAAIVGILGLTLVAWAFDRWDRGGDWHGQEGFGHGSRLMALLDNDRVRTYLNLTDPQVEQLRTIIADTEKTTIKDRADLAVRGIELRELMRADKPDRDAILKKVEEISQLRGQLMKEHVEALLAAKSVLTPEQQKKIHAFIERRGWTGPWAGRSMRHGGWMHPPSRPATPQAPAPPGEPPTQ